MSPWSRLPKAVRGTIWAVAATAVIGGLGAAADQRWLPRVEYAADKRQEIVEDLLAEVRELDRRIGDARSVLKWSDDDRERAVHQEKIRLLEQQKADIERRLKVFGAPSET